LQKSLDWAWSGDQPCQFAIQSYDVARKIFPDEQTAVLDNQEAARLEKDNAQK